MKKIILISALALTMSSASLAMASLSSDIQSVGMCKAVSNAVSQGTPVSSIIDQSAGMSQADQKALLNALHAAGASDDAIRISAGKAKNPNLIRVEASNTNSTPVCVDNHIVTPKAPAAPVAAKPAAPTGHEAAPIPAVATKGGETSPASGKSREAWAGEAGGRTMMLGEYWSTFYRNYKKLGIDEAVNLAVKEGIQPDALIEGGLALDDLNPQNLIKAMYCAGYKGDDIKKASDRFNLSELTLVAGFKKSKEECSERVTDSQAYTHPTGPGMADVPGPGNSGPSYPHGDGGGYASPSTF